MMMQVTAECTLIHRSGARHRRFCTWDEASDDVVASWGIGGDYRISIWSGRVLRTPWRLSRSDLAWFRKWSRRFAERRERFAIFLGAKVAQR